MSDMLEITPIQPIREIVYDRIKEAILAGSFDSGEHLVESELAARMRVSRTPVREALRKLESEGFLQAHPKQGLLVKSYSHDEIREIYLIRESLESLAAEHAARNATPRDVKKLETLAKNMEEMEENPDATSFDIFDAHRKFSEAYNRTCHMPTLVRMIESLREQMARFRKITLQCETRRLRAREEHRQLLDALKNGDGARAAELTRAHIRGAYDTYRDSTKKKEADELEII